MQPNLFLIALLPVVIGCYRSWRCETRTQEQEQEEQRQKASLVFCIFLDLIVTTIFRSIGITWGIYYNFQIKCLLPGFFLEKKNTPGYLAAY